MSKFILGLLTGMLMAFVVDFFILLGLKINYFDAYEMKIYYNVLFSDNQNFFLYFGCSMLFGYIVIFVSNTKLTVTLVIALSIISLAPFVGSIGENFGKMMFMKKDITYRDSKHIFYGDVYYDGRATIYFYDKQLRKMIILQKNKIGF